MDLSNLAVFLINGADFSGDDKIRAAGFTAGALGQAKLRTKTVQPVFGGDQLLPELLPPGGVGEISGAQDGNSLPAGPKLQHFRNTVPAGSPGVAGVNVQVGKNHDAAPFIGVFFYHTAFFGHLQEVKSM